MPGYTKSTCAMPSLGSMNGVGAPLRTPSCLRRIECEHKSCITQLNGKLLTSNIEGPCVPYEAHQALHPGSMPPSAHHRSPDQISRQSREASEQRQDKHCSCHHRNAPKRRGAAWPERSPGPLITRRRIGGVNLALPVLGLVLCVCM
jgi:hypothetical protein